MSKRQKQLLRQYRLDSQDIIAMVEDIPDLLDKREQAFEQNPIEADRDRLTWLRDDLVKVMANLSRLEPLEVDWRLLVRRLGGERGAPLPVEYAFPYGDLCGFVAALEKRFRLRRYDGMVVWLHACYSAEKGLATQNRSAVRAFLLSRYGRDIVDRLGMEMFGGGKQELYEVLLSFDWTPWKASFRAMEARLDENEEMPAEQ